MSTIGSIGSGAGAWGSTQTQRAARRPGGMDPGQLFDKVDSDGSGGIDATELQSLLDRMSGTSTGGTGTSADDTLTQFDADGDGSLGQDELEQAMQALRPPTSTLSFAQQRNAESAAVSSSGDDLFSKLDTDGSGEVSSDELQVMLDKMAEDHGASALSADDEINRLDSDGNGSLSAEELQAGRQMQGPGGPQGGPPPGPPPGELTDSGSSATDSLQTLLQAIDSDGDSTISESELETFEQVLQQIGQEASSSASSSASTSSSGIDLAALAQQVVQRYASLSSTTTSTATTGLSVAA